MRRCSVPTATSWGHFAVLDDKPMPREPGDSAVFRIFAARAAAELMRVRVESRPSESTPAKANGSEILTSSTAMQEILEDLRRVADTDAPVLIEGETGTGKELIARAIHAQSRRARKSFVTINCASIPESLAESELFGHEKGAFTGATEKRPGRFVLADGGSLFLDEVG